MIASDRSDVTDLPSDPVRFLTLQELIPADLQEKRLRLRSQLQGLLVPMIHSYVERADFPFEILATLKELKLIGLDSESYGCRQVSLLEKALNLYELARIDGGVATFYVVQSCLAMKSIELLGSEQQKNRYLKRMADLDTIGCFGLTEPNNGSDASGLTTSATPVKGGYLLSGCKRWIGNASHSDLIIVWARNSTNRQVEGFIVDSKAPGIHFSVIKRKLSLRIVQNADIILKDVFVPDCDRLEKATNFLTGVNQVLNSSRIFVPWVALGIMGGSYEAALKYTKPRFQFQAPLASYQLIQERLVRMLEYFTASFLQCWRLVHLKSCDSSQSASVKAQVTLHGREVVKLAREVLGGNGILIDNYVMKALLDMEAIYTYEGTYDINSLIAGKAILGISAIRGTYKL